MILFTTQKERTYIDSKPAEPESFLRQVQQMRDETNELCSKDIVLIDGTVINREIHIPNRDLYDELILYLKANTQII